MKRITLSALLMTLFLLMSCNNLGTTPKDGQAAKSDGTVIDLSKISKNIADAVAFAKGVKDVHTLVKSIDELAKAVGKKIKADGTDVGDDVGKNSSLVAGVRNIILALTPKLGTLEVIDGISDKLKTEIDSVKNKSKAFLDKLKDTSSDDDTKKAIDRIGKKDGDKGVA
ncbi:Vsp/OspC family lipoprotein [Borrelia hermsii]|uniref:Variable outer membrane protein n=1 Tax=Borrelia hermsii MTW TaxID=1313291 RepID=W5T5R1_BORHE|nr:Variable outer membrane protein [Borrelia hermsii MTW]